MKKKRKPISTTAALMMRITALLLGIVLSALVCFTIYTARCLRDHWHCQNERVAARFHNNELGMVTDLFPLMKEEPADVVELPLLSSPESGGEIWVGFTPARNDTAEQSTFPGEGTYTVCTFTLGVEYYYITDKLDHELTCYIDHSKVPTKLSDLLKEWSQRNAGVRLRGYFEGQSFTPVKAAAGSDWQVVWEGKEETTKPLFNLYINGLTTHEVHSEAVDTGDQTYENIHALAQTIASDEKVNTGDLARYEQARLTGCLFISSVQSDYIQYDYRDMILQPEEGHMKQSSCHCIVITRGNPLRTAMEQLLPVYVLSLLLTALILALLWRRIRKTLVHPMKQILRHGQKGMALLPGMDRPRWKEPYGLVKGYVQTRQTLRELELEQKQLQTKLDYVQNEEDNRRRLVSNVTHELKTPLATIHSYAECLHEDIAEDKREKYLNIILEESERMDGMVLQMLDLSRLEAGRVRLTTGEFCLLKLARQVVSRFDRLIGEKKLTIHFFGETTKVVADESRIEQVITNLVSNAVKYTSEGGEIWLKVYRYWGKIYLSVENQSPPLPEEILEHLWDSFYRAQESRSTPGTGLGLAIARAIVDLHRGSCEALNTEVGVEFRFCLPDT